MGRLFLHETATNWRSCTNFNIATGVGGVVLQTGCDDGGGALVQGIMTINTTTGFRLHSTMLLQMRHRPHTFTFTFTFDSNLGPAGTNMGFISCKAFRKGVFLLLLFYGFTRATTQLYQGKNGLSLAML